MEILEDIENGGIGGFFGDEIQNGNGIALAHGHADIKAGGEIPADDPHIFQLGGAVLHYRKEAFLLPGGDIQHGAAGADGQIEFFTEVHIFSPFGKGSVSAMECKRRGRGKIGKGQGAADAILLSGGGGLMYREGATRPFAIFTGRSRENYRRESPSEWARSVKPRRHSGGTV